jgi:hypothetical protein
MTEPALKLYVSRGKYGSAYIIFAHDKEEAERLAAPLYSEGKNKNNELNFEELEIKCGNDISFLEISSVANYCSEDI